MIPPMDWVARAFTRVLAFAALIAVGASGAALYSTGRGEVVEDIYRDKLAEVVSAHEALRTRYDAAVAQTVITELEVKGSQVTVLIRSVEGVVERIETDIDPKNEIHVDYLVVGNRLLIRRVYDDTIPARNARFIDPKLIDVDWSNAQVKRGVTVYRGGLTDGRWLISVSGNGALDLVKAEGPTPELMAGPPVIRKFDGMTQQLDRRLARVQTGEILQRLQTKYLGSDAEPATPSKP